MTATPLIPGRLYRVRGAGLDMTVIASHPCDAIRITIDLLARAEKFRSHQGHLNH